MQKGSAQVCLECHRVTHYYQSHVCGVQSPNRSCIHEFGEQWRAAERRRYRSGTKLGVCAAATACLPPPQALSVRGWVLGCPGGLAWPATRTRPRAPTHRLIKGHVALRRRSLVRLHTEKLFPTVSGVLGAWWWSWRRRWQRRRYLRLLFFSSCINTTSDACWYVC